ncbi:FAD-dependent oxidoreductase [Streptomyces sp. NPDC051976]|uniref:FAD-dependent oxidoreductase n=1 Tax=Streptomyces sp. NPDC051976 TaxID=3154947 RepID=UPI003444742B
MAATSSRHSADLLIVGGGPAGCAAALMAASLGMRSILIEADALCGKLQHIAAVNNVVGGFSSGPELGAAIAKDIGRTRLCTVELGVCATEIRADDDRVTVTTDTGQHLDAPYVVVATGVSPLPVDDAPWLAVATEAATPTLWGARLPDTSRGSLLILGADRPLGTFLRAHPALDATVLVAYPQDDDYKVDEVRVDPRVTLLPVTHLTLRPGGGSLLAAEWTDRQGHPGAATADGAFLNLGSAPTPPPGDPVRGSDGYCPPDQQHPRILTAGDLRSSRFQRIMVATGSGSEAALRAYYAAQDLPQVGQDGVAY